MKPTTFEQARAELRAAADDMAALKPQLGAREDGPVWAAFKVARGRFHDACLAYVELGAT